MDAHVHLCCAAAIVRAHNARNANRMGFVLMLLLQDSPLANDGVVLHAARHDVS